MINLTAKQVKLLTIMVVGLLLLSGALYADLVYQAPQPPPTYVWTSRGQVRLYDQVNIGDLVTSPDLGTVYYVNQNKERVVFPNEQTFLSWYADYSLVKNISQDNLEALPLSGRNVTIRPGTLLIKIVSSPQVWLVGAPHNLYWLQDGESQAQALFGTDWASRVVDLPEYFFTNYQEQQALSLEASLPAGILFFHTSSGKYYISTTGGLRVVTEAGLKANHFQTKYALSVSDLPSLPILPDSLDQFETRFGSPDIAEF